MGRLIDGEWSTRDLGPDERGRFVRRAAKFRGLVTADGSSGFRAVPGRYHLYVSHACGWSHRVMIMRRLKKLEEAISISYVLPFMGDEGWTFPDGADPVLGVRCLYEVYLKAKPDYTGRVSVPTLWDRETETIVTNESLDLIAILDREFDAFGDAAVHMFPADPEARAAVEAMITANYTVNNGVYRAGFAGNQEAHEEAVRDVFARMDALEQHLADRRYLMGDQLTAADWCLFPTLFRFDAVYNIHFKCSVRRLADYPNLWAYARDLYQTSRVRETCDLEFCKQHYYTSHESVNPRRLVPLGPTIDFDAPHDRARLGAAQ